MAALGPPDQPRSQTLHPHVHPGRGPGKCGSIQERYVRYDESNRQHFENDQAAEQLEISDIVSVLLGSPPAGWAFLVFVP